MYMYEVRMNDWLHKDVIHISKYWYDSITLNKIYIYIWYTLWINMYTRKVISESYIHYAYETLSLIFILYHVYVYIWKKES